MTNDLHVPDGCIGLTTAEASDAQGGWAWFVIGALIVVGVAAGADKIAESFGYNLFGDGPKPKCRPQEPSGPRDFTLEDLNNK